ncbi:HisA/HisF-related TIM barrel protein [Actinokineospora auranticolor]|uniref:Phosphoribosylanthranilate isomerase n=1 Tax=Actinokineospora auranticolor TaxID=155976 RepID=A0A2S6GIX6_9PSEU|nr:HisA/HisF-related TIM barrel protein [Actinokineospora auranticolor]PPK65184.1 phosphoribosylanthranilate isomerase [Actinokineospora auranticolor]
MTTDAFTVFPSIHVARGRVVHLVGDGHVPEPVRVDPVRTALEFQRQGATWLHLVAVDDDIDTVRRVIGAVDIDVQLMCRDTLTDDASLDRALATGCARLNLGRSALTDLDWCARAVSRHSDRLGVSLPVRTVDDARHVAGPGHGTTVATLTDVITTLDQAGCTRYVVTDVTREGTLSGPNFPLFEDVCAATPTPVLAAGGISSLGELRSVATLAPRGVAGAIIGRALYANAFTFSQALSATTGSGQSRSV